MHAGSKHLVNPISSQLKVEFQQSMVRLRSDLQNAIEQEDYEEAARIRDQLKDLENESSLKHDCRLICSTTFYRMKRLEVDLESIPVTLSTRIRLARNLSDYPFPGRAESSQRRAVLTKCLDALQELSGLDKSIAVEVDELVSWNSNFG